MSNIIQRFVAGRPAAKPQAIANVGDTVSRADFDKLVGVVNTMAKAVEGLIEDVGAATDPAKMQAVFNTALKDVMPAVNAARRGNRSPLALPGDRSHLTPSASDRFIIPSDDDDGVKVNAKGGRPPLALPADRGHLIPQGD